MTDQAGVIVKLPQLLVAGVLLVALGAGAAYVVVRRPEMAPAPSSTAPAAPSVTAIGPKGPLSDVALTLSPEAVQRAGLEIVAARTVAVETTGLRIPGIVQPNAYRTVKVTPVTGGRVTRVSVELGSAVARGQTLAEIYSPELSEAVTRFLSAQAALDAHERMLQRTTKLAEIGAASRQELEQVHAEHAAALTAVESARSRLVLLGLKDDQIGGLNPSTPSAATLAVPSPIDGLVTERQANSGLNVEASTQLFTVSDLSTVWIVGNVYERDFARVRLGSPVTITSAAYPSLRLDTRISYIDPQVNTDARTAQVRVEVPNRHGELKFGMYTEMNVGQPQGSDGVAVPRAAIQNVSDRTVVYLAASETGHFVEREVTLGETVGDDVTIVSGVQAGDRIVARGSFALRAERERLGLRK